MNKTYKNPVYGNVGVFGGDAPEFLTRKELIKLAADNAIGSSDGISGSIDSFIDWLSEASGEEIEFRSEDFTIEEWSEVDQIVFCCSQCCWNHEAGEHHEYYGDSVCGNCYDDLHSENDDEDE